MRRPLPANRRLGWTILFALLLLAACRQAEGREVIGKVLWIYDGDTLKISGVGKVRLIGIDTPEREPSERDRFYARFDISPKKLRTVAEEALHFNIDTVKGKTVRLTFGPEERDRHGRTLAYVTLPDGRLLNRLLLEQGLAVVYRRFDFRFKQDFLAVEAEARRRRVGLWSP